MRTCQSLLADHQILMQMHHQDFCLSFTEWSILAIQPDVLVCSPPKNQQHIPWQWWQCINQMQIGWKMCWNWTLRHNGVHDKGRSKRIHKRSKTQPETQTVAAVGSFHCFCHSVSFHCKETLLAERPTIAQRSPHIFCSAPWWQYTAIVYKAVHMLCVGPAHKHLGPFKLSFPRRPWHLEHKWPVPHLVG